MCILRTVCILTCHSLVCVKVFVWLEYGRFGVEQKRLSESIWVTARNMLEFRLASTFYHQTTSENVLHFESAKSFDGLHVALRVCLSE